ncbi:hypothetical protein [Chromobacterium aquaticum]
MPYMSVIKPFSPNYAAELYRRPSSASASSAATDPSQAAVAAVAGAKPKADDSLQAKQALQSSLQQTLGNYMRQLKVALKPLPKRSPEVDDMQKTLLKKKVDMLLQMVQMAGRDKASLKALAAELARAVKELKQLVASMTQNAADSMMSVGMGGDAAAAASAAAAGDAAPAASDGGGDASGAAAQAQAQAAAAEDEPQQAKGGEEGALAAAGARGDAAAANGDKSAAAARDDGATPRTGGGNPLSGGNPVAGDRTIQDIVMKLKQLQNWLKQQTRQLQADQEFRKMMKEMEKDMASIDKMLETGEISGNGEMDVQVHVDADAGANVNVQA